MFLSKLLPWGPVFFGALIFAPVLATVLESLGTYQLFGQPVLAATLILGITWGVIAKQRGRWL
jgi:hypothetical protein